MLTLARLGLLTVAFLAPLWSAETTVPAASQTPQRHVIMVVVDGPRWCDTWGKEGRPDIPQRAALAAQGTLFINFSNDGVTKTNPGHTALITGFYQDLNNSGKELPAHPSLFQLYLAKTGAPATETWLVTTKDKLEVLNDTTDPQWAGKFRPSSDCGKGGKGVGSGYRQDTETMERLLPILAKDHPHLVLVNFREPDSSGHANDWAGYLQGIRDTDAHIGTLWKFIQADPIYANTTTLLVTNDHGRHDDGHADGFVSHGDDCPGCRHIELFAIGAGVPAGQIVDKHYGQIDAAVTMAAMLGVTIPGSAGKPIPEILAAAP